MVGVRVRAGSAGGEVGGGAGDVRGGGGVEDLVVVRPGDDGEEYREDCIADTMVSMRRVEGVTGREEGDGSRTNLEDEEKDLVEGVAVPRVIADCCGVTVSKVTSQSQK